MSTVAQVASNILNAQHSTGPRTPETKAISSQNSLKHGLTAKTVLLPGEDPAEYQSFSDDVISDLAPATEVESALARELVDLQWRLLRVPTLEARILSADDPDFRALNNISLHASRMKRQYSASLKELLQLKGIRHQSTQAAMQEAATLRRADLILQRPSNLAAFGFVFTLDEVDDWIRREDTLEAARVTVADNRPGARRRL
jgi:hypothetical protein